MSKYILVAHKNLKEEDSKKMGKGEGEGKGSGGDDWQNSTFGCLGSPGNCKYSGTLQVNILSTTLNFSGLCGLCCHPCQFGSVASKLDESYLLWFIIGCCAPCIPAFMLRGKVRDRYKFKTQN